MHINHVKTAKNDETYETLKTVLNQGENPNLQHTVEVRLKAHPVNAERDDLYHEVWIDGQLIETSKPVGDPTRAYMDGRKAWRRAITEVLDKNWPLPD